MARYRTMRARRYGALLWCGFLKFEGRALSRIPYSRVPYMKDIMAIRNREYEAWARKYNRMGVPEAQFNKLWETHIKQRYNTKGWKRRGENWGATVAYRMLKEIKPEIERKYGYTSPWVKRRKDWVGVRRKIESEYDMGNIRKSKKPSLRGARGDRWLE